MLIKWWSGAKEVFFDKETLKKDSDLFMASDQDVVKMARERLDELRHDRLNPERVSCLLPDNPKIAKLRLRVCRPHT